MLIISHLYAAVKKKCSINTKKGEKPMIMTQEHIVSEVEYQCAKEFMELIQRLPLEAQRKFLNMLQGAVAFMDVQNECIKKTA